MPPVVDEPQEPEPETYCLAARFNTDNRAGRAYFQLQEYVRTHPDELELSVYRFSLRGQPMVAVVGNAPGEEPGRFIDRALSRGTRVTLEEDVLRFLQERRVQETQRGTWVERHFRPGQGFRFER